ncbi:hypothetical protein [Naumannella cuiyingiana]|uniref:Uncharacterized protein n=1 Tax=Naumannella cuiyingiana TaxID=1347891 RepID=A0A7Z0IKR2_9ACTN|nr:hypothetical protein [Naumannella cuiyingiana]NYI70717.1 hypothetical protein [Naumannella cuiyingiana]
MLQQLTRTPVPWERGALTERREGALRGLTWPAVSLTGTLVGLVAVTAWIAATRAGVSLPFFVMVFFGLSVLSGAGFLGYGILRAVRAHQELGLAGEGIAFEIDHDGITTSAGKAPWEAVQAITTLPGGALHGPLLRIDHRLGRDEYPVDALGVLPGSLESAVRIFSRGRHGVDLSAIED